MDSIIVTLIIGLISFILGWAIPAVFKRYDKADLKLEILDDYLNTNPGSHKFLHIKVLNIKRRWLKKILFGEKAALFCKAKIQYLSINGFELLQNSLSGRWSSTGEPVLQIDADRYFQYNMVPSLRFEHILPGDYANLAIAIKIPGEKSFYAFDNESYAYLTNIFKDPNKEIEEKSCVISIKIVCSDGSYSEKKFVINNPNNRLSSFKIIGL